MEGFGRLCWEFVFRVMGKYWRILSREYRILVFWLLKGSKVGSREIS